MRIRARARHARRWLRREGVDGLLARLLPWAWSGAALGVVTMSARHALMQVVTGREDPGRLAAWALLLAAPCVPIAVRAVAGPRREADVLGTLAGTTAGALTVTAFAALALERSVGVGVGLAAGNVLLVRTPGPFLGKRPLGALIGPAVALYVALAAIPGLSVLLPSAAEGWRAREPAWGRHHLSVPASWTREDLGLLLARMRGAGLLVDTAHGITVEGRVRREEIEALAGEGKLALFAVRIDQRATPVWSPIADPGQVTAVRHLWTPTGRQLAVAVTEIARQRWCTLERPDRLVLLLNQRRWAFAHPSPKPCSEIVLRPVRAALRPEWAYLLPAGMLPYAPRVQVR